MSTKIRHPAGELAARDLEQWVEHNRASLLERGVTALFGRAPRLGRVDGATWISFSSSAVDARVIREADGSCDVDAHRFRDGLVLKHEHHTLTTREQLDAVVALLALERRSSTAVLSSGGTYP